MFHHSSHAAPRHRHLVLVVALGGVVTLLLFLGSREGWWYVPAGAVAFHLAAVGAVAFVVSGMVRRTAVGTLIRWPRVYDGVVGVMTLGREGRMRARTLELAGLRPGDAVLDVGCGTGTLLVGAAARVGAAGSLHGVEPSPEMLAHARRKAKARGVEVTLLEGAADSLPFADASFDVVFCTLVLHHIPPEMRREALREMRRVARPGGRLVVMELARPASVSGVLAPAALLHGVRGRGPSRALVEVREGLVEAGCDGVEEQTAGSGVAVTIGHVPAP